MKRLILTIFCLLFSFGVHAGPSQDMDEAVIAVINTQGGGSSVEYSDATDVFLFENNGNANNSSGHDLTGIDTPTYDGADAQQGTYSADPNGTSEYFTLADGVGAGDDFDVPANTDYSMSFWFKSDDTGELNIVEKYGGTGSGYYIVSQFQTPGNNIKIIHYDSWATQTVDTGVNIAVDTWYHGIIVYDVSEANEMIVWVSTAAGTFGDTINGTAFNMDVDPAPNSVALNFCYNAHFAEYYVGHLDEFAFFNGTALTAENAEDIYDKAWQ